MAFRSFFYPSTVHGQPTPQNLFDHFRWQAFLPAHLDCG